MKIWCGQIFYLAYVRFGMVVSKVHLFVRAEFVYWKAGMESFRSSHMSFRGE